MKKQVQYCISIILLFCVIGYCDSVVVFNEIMYHPSQDEANLEWIELYNQMSVDVDLGQWSISDGIDYEFPAGTILCANQYLVVASNPTSLAAETGFSDALGPFDGRLSNSGETIRLRNKDKRIMDEIEYNDSYPWPLASDGAGVSLAKIKKLSAGVDPENWHWSAEIGGTAGEENFPTGIGASGLVFSEVQGALSSEFYVEIYNAGLSLINTQGYVITDWAGQYVLPSFNLVAGGYMSFNATQLGFTPSQGAKLFLFKPSLSQVADAVEVAERLIARSSDDMAGRWHYPDVATPASANSFAFHDEIVINEIMYHHIPQYAENNSEIDSQELISWNSSWKYDESGVAPSYDWNTLNYDASSWESGPGVFGYETSTLTQTINTQFNLNGQLVYYLRRHFTFDGDVSGAVIKINTLVDDGVILYLNGQEVYSWNVPVGSAVNNATESVLFTIPSDSLLQGDNVLAAEVHQHKSTSSDVVFGMKLIINETLSGTDYAENDQEWLELYNCSDVAVDISGWKLNDAIDFEFAEGTVMQAGEYVVVANGAEALSSQYPSARIVGDYSGSLNNGHDNIELIDDAGNLADNVQYYDSSPWPSFADGGGPSLELCDPDADNNCPEAWAESQELQSWQHYSYSAVATKPVFEPTINFHEFVLGILYTGQILLDNISVIENPDSTNYELIQNGTFESDVIEQSPDKWRIQGTHKRSMVVNDPANSANKVLHLIADGECHYLGNHAETTLANGRTVVDGITYKISFNARRVVGSPQFHTELYYCDVPKTTILEVPGTHGTCGYQNSCYQDNVGPTFTGLSHSPAIPTSSQSVTVTVKAEDPDNIAFVRLYFSVDEGSWAFTTMTSQGSGLYQGIVPAKSDDSVVQFYVLAEDGLGAGATYPAAGQNSHALYEVDDAYAADPIRQDIRFIMKASEVDYMCEHPNIMSNSRMGATVIYNADEIFYNAGVRLKGSMWSRHNKSRMGFSVKVNADKLFRGVHDTFTLRKYSKTEIPLRHMAARSGGIPAIYDDMIVLKRPDNIAVDGDTNGLNVDGIVALSMARYSDTFLDSQYENGSEGTKFKLDGQRILETTDDGTAEGLKIFSPIGWNWNYDIQNLGDDKEQYRWGMKITNNLAKDDYGPLIEMMQSWSLTGTALREAAERTMDIDEWMRNFALMSLCGINDVYNSTVGYAQSHNLVIYQRPSDQKMLAMMWDWDNNAIIFNPSTTAGLYGGQNLSNIIDLPGIKRVYYGHLKDWIDTVFNVDYMTYWVNHYKTISGNDSDYDGFPAYITARSNYVLSKLPAEISFGITSNGGSDFSIDDAAATLQGNGWINVHSIMQQGADDPLAVTWVDDETWQAVVPLEPGVNSLVVEAYDFQGGLVGSDSITVTSTVAERPLKDSLRIAELMYDPIDGTDYEFIELQNTGTTSLDISAIAFTEGIEFDFASGSVAALEAGEYVLVVRDLAAFSTMYDAGSMLIAGEYSGKLANEGEKITLVDQYGSELISFEYGDSYVWPLAVDGLGHSLVPVSSAMAGQTEGSLDWAGNWRASAYINGSPGQADPELASLLINEFAAHTDYASSLYPEYDSNDWIEIYNSSNNVINIGVNQWFLSDDDDNLQKWALPAMTIPAYSYVVFDEISGFHSPITSGFGLDKAGEQIYLSYLPGDEYDRIADAIEFNGQDNGVSFGRYPDGQAYWVTMDYSQGDSNSDKVDSLVISEIMYNPALDDTEYVEIYNPTSQAVSLWNSSLATGWRLYDGIEFSFQEGTTLDAGESMLVVEFTPDTVNVANFKAIYGQTEAQIVGPFDAGSLSNSTDRIVLQRPIEPDVADEEIIWVDVDDVNYFDSTPWPSEADGLGSSLQRKDVSIAGSDPANWRSDEPSPGFKNRQPADFDYDGQVNLIDFGVFADFWQLNWTDEDWDDKYNLVDDEQDEINLEDLASFMQSWLGE